MKRAMTNEMSSPDNGESEANSWPEQDAVFEWWQKHRLELCKMVSAYRISCDRKRDAETEPEVQDNNDKCCEWRETGRSYCTLKVGHAGPHVCPSPTLGHPIMIQPEYSNWHTYCSYVKSVIRIIACLAAMMLGSVFVLAIGLLIAECVGIVEEFG